MSTHYGFLCETCGRDGDGYFRARWIIDGCRDPETLAACLADIDAVERVTAMGFRLTLDRCQGTDVEEAVAEALAHARQGHRVIACNEYGDEFKPQ